MTTAVFLNAFFILLIYVPFAMALHWHLMGRNLRRAGLTPDDIPGGRQAGLTYLFIREFATGLVLAAYIALDPVWAASGPGSMWRLLAFVAAAITVVLGTMWLAGRISPRMKEVGEFLRPGRLFELERQRRQNPPDNDP